MHCSKAMYCSTAWNKWDPALRWNAFFSAFQLLHTESNTLALNVHSIFSSSLRQMSRVLSLTVRPFILVPLWVSLSNSSGGCCQFESIWQVAFPDSRVAYGFQMRLGHPATMPIRQSCPLYPICEEKRIQHEVTECSCSNHSQFYDQTVNKGKGSEVDVRSLLCWCTRMTSAFSNDSSSGCWATNARIHCICVKSAWTKEKRGQTYSHKD